MSTKGTTVTLPTSPRASHDQPDAGTAQRAVRDISTPTTATSARRSRWVRLAAPLALTLAGVLGAGPWQASPAQAIPTASAPLDSALPNSAVADSAVPNAADTPVNGFNLPAQRVRPAHLRLAVPASRGEVSVEGRPQHQIAHLLTSAHFDVAGLTWNGLQGNPTLQLRARTAAGWSGWSDTGADGAGKDRKSVV